MTDTSENESLIRSSRPLADVFWINSELGREQSRISGESSAHASEAHFPGGGAMSIHTRLAAAASAAVVAAALALPASAASSIPLNSGQEPAGGEADGHGFFSYTI
jgi:hypothetical protein